jgi:hypothetical protein
MNARILFAATVAVALLSTLAMADEGKPLTREQIVADFNQAAANGTLRKNDYDFDAVSTRTRAQALAELAAARNDHTLVGPLRNRTYNPYGAELLRPSTLARTEVKAEVLAARRDGTLRRSDYDDEQIRGTRRGGDHIAASILAARQKSAPAGG